MALKIRMRQQGSINKQHFRVVLTDSRAPRDGGYIENLGWYDPMAPEDKGSSLKIEQIEKWISLGAQMSENVEALVKRIAPEVIGRLIERRQKKLEKKRAKKKASKKA